MTAIRRYIVTLVLGVGGYQNLSVVAKGASFGIPASQQLLSGSNWVSVKELKFKYYSKETLSCTLYTHIIVTQFLFRKQ